MNWKRKKKEIVRMTSNVMEIEWKKKWRWSEQKDEWERWKDRQNVKPNETVQIMECVTNIVFIE